MSKVTVESQWHGKEIKIAGKRVVGKTAFEIGLVVEGQAKLLAPIKTGRLAGSITTQAFDHGDEPEAPATATDKIQAPGDENEVLVGTNVDYAAHVCFGTVKSKAQPFLRPALDLARGKTLTIVQNNARYEFKDYLK